MKDDLGRLPVHLIGDVEIIVADVSVCDLKALIRSDPEAFLYKLANKLNVEPDPAIIHLIVSDADVFVDRICSIIDTHRDRHTFAKIAPLLKDVDLFSPERGRALKRRRLLGRFAETNPELILFDSL